MRKIILSLTLVFAFMFNANAVNTEVSVDCVQLALDIGDAYEEAGYDDYTSWQHANWAYEGCIKRYR